MEFLEHLLRLPMLATLTGLLTINDGERPSPLFQRSGESFGPPAASLLEPSRRASEPKAPLSAVEAQGPQGDRTIGGRSCTSCSIETWQTEIAFFVCWLLAVAVTQSSAEFCHLQEQQKKQRHQSLALQCLGAPEAIQRQASRALQPVQQEQDQTAQWSSSSYFGSPSNVPPGRRGSRCTSRDPKEGPRLRAAEACTGTAVGESSGATPRGDPRLCRADGAEGSYQGLLTTQDFSLFGFPEGRETGSAAAEFTACPAGPKVLPEDSGENPLVRDGRLVALLVRQLQHSSSSTVQRLASLVLLWCPSWWLMAEAVVEGSASSDTHEISATSPGISSRISRNARTVLGSSAVSVGMGEMSVEEPLGPLSAPGAEKLLRGLDGAGVSYTPRAHFLRLHAHLVLLHQVIEETRRYGDRLHRQQQQLQHRLRLSADRGVVLPDALEHCLSSHTVLQQITAQEEGVLGAHENPGSPVAATSPPPTLAASYTNSLYDGDEGLVPTDSSRNEAAAGLQECSRRMMEATRGCSSLAMDRLRLQQQLLAHAAYVEMTRNKLEALVTPAASFYLLFL